MMDLGTVATAGAAGELVVRFALDRATRKPAAGAGPLRVTVPVELSDTSIEGGFKDSPVTTGGAATVRVAATVCPPRVTVMLDIPSASPVTLKDTDVAPMFTGTGGDGTPTMPGGLLRPMVNEPLLAGAGLLKVTVIVDVSPT